MSMNTDIYSKIYDIAEKNLQKSGEEMVFSKDAFLYSTRQDLKHINVFDMPQYDNETLLQVLYVALFFRTPEENARLNWGKLKDMPKKEFQKRCFTTLASSQEFQKNGTILYNNIYSSPQVQINVSANNAVAANPYIEKLYGIYRKLPKSLKNMIKKVLGGKR